RKARRCRAARGRHLLSLRYQGESKESWCPCSTSFRRTRIVDRIDPRLHEEPRFGLDSELRQTHAHSMKQLVISATIGLIAIAGVAAADAIQKWRTPDGSFYFGDRPPTGSTLLATYPDTPASPASVGSSNGASLSQAAADGRDIIRGREAERA